MKFYSRCPNQIITMIPNRKQIHDGIVVPISGKRIQFVNGVYETKDKKEIAFLKDHRLFGISITSDTEDEIKTE